MQRCVTTRASEVHIRPLLDEQPHKQLMAVLAGHAQERVSLRIAGVEVESIVLSTPRKTGF